MPEFAPPQQPTHPATQNAYSILTYAHDTAESLIEAFANVRAARGAGRGASTDEDQDLLRAMVVFAGAGLDAMTKQLIRDALPRLVDAADDVRDQIERLVARHLSRGARSPDQDDAISVSTIDPNRLAKVLLSETPRQGVLEMLVDDLTKGSLQSATEVYRILGYFGMDRTVLGVSDQELRDVFDVRNRIIHEMDIDFTQPNRNRFPRRRGDMVRFAATVLSASNAILQHVDSRLTALRRR